MKVKLNFLFWFFNYHRWFAFVSWWGYCYASFQSFALLHLVIKPIRNTKSSLGNTQKLPNFQICFLNSLIIHEENSPRSWRDWYMRGVVSLISGHPYRFLTWRHLSISSKLFPLNQMARTGLGTGLAEDAFRWRDLAVPPPKINSNRKDRNTTKNSKSCTRNKEFTTWNP